MKQYPYLRNTESGRFEVFGDFFIRFPFFAHLNHDRTETVPVPARCGLFFGFDRPLFRFIGTAGCLFKFNDALYAFVTFRFIWCMRIRRLSYP